ncbi:MAG: hypothetical protein HFJ95_04400 [Muribaculaceae bacterium]|nr:hypothetical protein [Muribaculaceae bacterium]
MNRILKAIFSVLLLLPAVWFVSCQVDRIEVPASEEYNREFIKKFGVPDNNISWNSATTVTVSVDPSLLGKASKLNIYTAWPGNPDCHILASWDVTSGDEFRFDCPVDMQAAYVNILDSESHSLFASYVAINDGSMKVGERAASRAGIVTPVPYHFDLTSNKSLGTIPVDKDYNKDFWAAFKSNSGENIVKVPEAWVPNYGEYIPLSLYLNDQLVDSENGCALVDWQQQIRLRQGTLPSDVTSNSRVMLRIKYSALENDSDFAGAKETYSTLKMDYIKPDTSWDDYMEFKNLKGNEGFIEQALSVSQVEILKNNEVVIHGNCVRIYSIEFKEIEPETIVNIADVFNLYGFTSSPQSTFDGFKNSYLRPNNTYDEVGYSCADLVGLIGKKNGKFSEEIDENNKCNLEKFSDLFNKEEGVTYIVREDNTEVSLDYFFGCASTFNCFGYFYCTDEEAKLPEAERVELLLKKPKFVLIYSANQGTNMLLQENEGEPWKYDTKFETADIVPSGPNEGKDQGDNWTHCTRFTKFVENAENGDYVDKFAPRFRSANYRLVYYSPEQIENGRLKPGAMGTYKFPKGTHIGFFIINGGRYALDRNGTTAARITNRHISFSRPYLNKYIANTIHGGHSHAKGEGNNSKVINGNGEEEPWTAFVTYEWNGQLMMGVEDYFAENHGIYEGGDHDMNDLLFRVNGEFEREREELNEDPVKRQAWVIACEDLGGTFDYDFNDVVFGVTHVGGEEIATVTALASGGTLPVYLWSKYPQVDAKGNPVEGSGDGVLCSPGSNNGEFHSWWGGSRPSSSHINASSWGGPGATVYIKVPADFSIAPNDTHYKPGEGDDNMGGFKVLVRKPGENENTVITAPNKDASFVAPQMFLVPNSWYWPTETQAIDGVYPGFVPWSSRWWNNRSGQNADRVIKHNWMPVYDK